MRALRRRFPLPRQPARDHPRHAERGGQPVEDAACRVVSHAEQDDRKDRRDDRAPQPDKSQPSLVHEETVPEALTNRTLSQDGD